MNRPGRQAGIGRGEKDERRRCGIHVKVLCRAFSAQSFAIILSRPDGRAY